MGHEYRATVRWSREDGAPFTDNKYSRAHVWRFDGGVEVVASSAPSSVPLPLSRADAVDPEEAFIAALSSCHMLTFLDLARRAGVVVESYEDEAIGTMGRLAPGKIAVTKVTLRPRVAFAGSVPDGAKLDELHHQAHEGCFIANSVTTEIAVEPVNAADLPRSAA